MGPPRSNTAVSCRLFSLPKVPGRCRSRSSLSATRRSVSWASPGRVRGGGAKGSSLTGFAGEQRYCRGLTTVTEVEQGRRGGEA